MHELSARLEVLQKSDLEPLATGRDEGLLT